MMDSKFDRFHNAFKLLGVEVGASFRKIKSSYRQLAKKIHPDKNRGEDEKLAHENFTMLRDSYLLLCNEVERKRFEEEYTSFNGRSKFMQDRELKANNFSSLIAKTSKTNVFLRKESSNGICLDSLHRESIHLINAFRDRFKSKVKANKGNNQKNLRGALNYARVDKIVDKFGEFEKMVMFKLASIIQPLND